MGVFSSLGNFFLRLSESDRQTIWQYFGSFKSNQFAMNTGALIENSYEKNVDVYAVIKKIVDVTKSVPWIVEQRQYNGNWKQLNDTSIHELMANPNVTKGYTWNDIEEQIMLYLLVTGNAYLIGEKPFMSGQIAEVDVLPSTAVTIKTNDDFFLPTVNYEFRLGKNVRNFTKDDLTHIKFFNPNYYDVTESLYGLSIIEVAAKVVQVGNDRWDANANLFQNRGANGLITDKSQRPMTQDEAQIVQSSWDASTAGSSNFGKIKVTNKDLNYIPMGMSPADLQLLESGVVNLRSICNVFGIDSSLFNDPANKTYNNQLEAQKALYTNAIMPLSDKLSEHFTRFIAQNHFPNKTVRMRQDFSKIECLQENLKDKSSILINLKNSGIYTANEVREKLGDAKISDDNADKLLINTNIVADLGNNTNNQLINTTN
jgi:HK97 family phage portal protein